MRVAFLVNDVVDKESGVGKKIVAQASAMEKTASEFLFIENLGSQRLVNSNVIISEKNVFFNVQLRFKFDELFIFLKSKKIDVIYIRYTHFASPGLLRFFSKLKSIKIKIVIEIPTYPYDNEYKLLGYTSKLKLVMDQCYRGHIHKYVDRCVTLTPGFSEIFKMPVVCISNAVDSKLIDKREKIISKFEKKIKNEVVFAAVASMHYWHGYDRLLYSLHEYNKTKNRRSVFINLVGDGPELKNLKNLASELSLEKYVNFFGELVGDDLDDVMLNSHIGVDSLGRFRTGNDSNNSLKSKEYLSIGLPVIKSHIDCTIDDLPYVYTLENNESIFDINSILDWYNEGKFEKFDINRMCKNRFSWDKQVLNVFQDYVDF